MTTTERISSFFREVIVEMKKVTWLTRNQVLQYTLITVGAMVVVAFFLGGLDYLFTEILKRFILQ